jgi:hypothetical protein
MLVAFGVSGGPEVLACGDKFFVPGRGARFELPPLARQAAAILIYAPPGSELSRRLVRLSVAEALRKVGYQPTIAAGAQDLAAAIQGRQWDLVVADVADLRKIPDGNPDRRLVPVTYATDGAEWTAAKREYPSILKAPTRVRSFVDAVDAALQAQRAERDAALRKRL